MKKLTTSLTTCAALILLGVGVTPLANAAYTFTDLGTLLGDGNSEAWAINNTGQVAGFSFNTTLDASRATIWNGLSITALSAFGGHNSMAFAVNNVGQVAGGVNISTTGNDWHASLWNGATATDLGSGFAYAINDAGQVAGSSGNQAILWNGTSATDLGYGAALAINSSGQVAGASGYQAVLWNGTTATYLDGLGGLGSRATAINDAGLVVGYGWTVGNTATHATIWNGATITDLGTLGGNSSVAYAINNAGQVVGYASTTDGFQHASLWNGTTATDLNGFLDAATISAGWELATAYGINDNGWIVGIARNSLSGGQMHGYLLSDTASIPAVPEPETYALMLIGLGMMGFIARRRKNIAA